MRAMPTEDMAAAVVSYEDWPRHFDELQLLQNLRTAGGDEVSGLGLLKKDDTYSCAGQGARAAPRRRARRACGQAGPRALRKRNGRLGPVG